MVSSDANLGAASGGLTFNGGTLQNRAGFTSARDITLQPSGGTLNTYDASIHHVPVGELFPVQAP